MVIRDRLLWAGVILLGAVSLGIVALTRGEPVNAAWLVIAAVCIYFIAYRFYALYIVNRAFRVDAARQTPAFQHNDGLDYVPTNRYVLYGHHFAAIAGAGPLVGPVLAAQMGYLPGRDVAGPEKLNFGPIKDPRRKRRGISEERQLAGFT